MIKFIGTPNLDGLLKEIYDVTFNLFFYKRGKLYYGAEFILNPKPKLILKYKK